ncbi:MAG TPA: GNAT family N-acetyltransferase [Pseudonocardiaceae bacterium]|jgi:RimJ/RimL family protein N-acetyltransferase
MFRPDYPIKTERLVLRPYATTDLDALHDVYSRPEVVRYLYEEPRPLENVRTMIAERLDRVGLEKADDVLSLVVALAEDPDTAIGTAMLRWVSEEHAQGEVGYTLHPDQQGKGYATELTRALVDLGFRETELHRIFGRLDARNTASQRVLEKSGMRVEAHLVENEWVKGEWTSEIVCAVLRTEWEQAQLSK